MLMDVYVVVWYVFGVCGTEKSSDGCCECLEVMLIDDEN
jgi:hypothetical protein